MISFFDASSALATTAVVIAILLVLALAKRVKRKWSDTAAKEAHKQELLNRGYSPSALKRIIKYHEELDAPEHGGYQGFFQAYMKDPIVIWQKEDKGK